MSLLTPGNYMDNSPGVENEVGREVGGEREGDRERERERERERISSKSPR